MYPSERIDEQISKETASELGENLHLIEMVTRFQFKTALEATQVATSIELTDLGVFKATKTKLTRKLSTFRRKLEINEKKNVPDLSERKKETLRKTMNTIKGNIEFLTIKRATYEN